jgi:hypothetical protein
VIYLIIIIIKKIQRIKYNLINKITNPVHIEIKNLITNIKISTVTVTIIIMSIMSKQKKDLKLDWQIKNLQ